MLEYCDLKAILVFGVTVSFFWKYIYDVYFVVT